MRIEANVIKADMHGVEILWKGNEVCHREIGEGLRSLYKITEIISAKIAKQHRYINTSPQRHTRAIH